ncbi:MAG TPA: sulfurtransferase TusA family protein [Acidimicrobiales bacterium]|nr:sulfurtransferase TusA family protein [Acidimicrobiales bacterium]
MGGTQVQEDTVLDARGLLCPMPIVKTAKLMKTLEPGQVVKLVTTDKGSLADVPAWASSTGNELVASHDGGTEFTFFLRKA